MLSRLYIKNLAIISELEIEFADGFNVFTGKTGAGKSLIVGAIEVLLGLRSFGNLVAGNKQSQPLISGEFFIKDNDLLSQIQNIIDIPIEDNQIIIVRKLLPSGKVSTTINAVPVPTNILKQISELLVDIHRQHENQFLLKPKNQLYLLDRFGNTLELANKFAKLTSELKKLIDKYEEISANQDIINQKLDLYQYQLDEINKIDPKEGELDELKRRYTILSNIDSLRETLTEINYLLEQSDEHSVIDTLRNVYRLATDLPDFDENLKDIPTRIESTITELSDISESIADYLDNLEFDQTEFQKIDERLTALTRLAQKYGKGEYEKIFEYKEFLEKNLNELTGEDSNLETLSKRIDELKEKRKQLGKELSKKRKQSAKKLCKLINEELKELAMEGANYDIEFKEADQLSSVGLEEIEFIVQTNPGQPFLPLRKIASGGELSRITLAIKSILSSADRSSVLIFDEVDSNVGGRLGEVIGKKLKKLSANQQVICITHLPQIACFADRHFVVQKTSSKTETVSAVKPLEGDDRIKELAEMISGKSITPTTLKQAKELLKSSTSAI